MDVKVKSISFGEYIEGHGHAVEVRRGEIMDHGDGRYQYSIFNLNPRITVERVGGAGQFTQLECRISIPAYGFVAQQAFPVTILAPQTTCDILLPFNGIHTIGKIDPKPADLEMEILDKGQVVFGGKLPIAFVVPPRLFRLSVLCRWMSGILAALYSRGAFSVSVSKQRFAWLPI